nr:Flp pilus assembly complex ATPase component TadA [Bacilli bacterium]
MPKTDDFWDQSRDEWAAINQVDLTDNDLFKWQEVVLRELQEITNKEGTQSEVSRATREAQLSTLIATHKDIPIKVRRSIVVSLLDDMFSFGPLQSLWNDSKISDMQVFVPTDNRETQIITYSSAAGRRVYDGAGFRDYGHVMTWLNRHLAQFGQHYDAAKVSMDAVFPNGERMHVITGVSGYSTFRRDANGEMSYHFVPCVIITMRRFTNAFTLGDLTARSPSLAAVPQFSDLREVKKSYTRKTLYTQYDGRSLDPATIDYLKIIVQMAKNHVISGGTGCHDADAPILMFDGSTKRAADVQLGDQLMGSDSTPRTVVDLHRGVDRMVRVIPNKGEPFVVNEGHVLSLKTTPKEVGDTRKTRSITIAEYRGQHKKFKHLHKLWRTDIEFASKNLLIEPYFLGLLLGDGSIGNHRVAMCSPDPEIIQRVYDEARIRGLHVRVNGYGTSRDYYICSDVKGEYHKNNLIYDLKALGLYGTHAGDKFIPTIYKTASRQQRLELLAGLLDTDGSWGGGGYDYITKSEQLATDIQFLSRSLGFSTSISKCNKGFTRSDGTKFVGQYFRLCVSGNCEQIPCKVARKKGTVRQQKKDVLVTGFTLEDVGYGNYYGWELDGDHLYLDGQFIVHHNSGKSSLANALTAEIPDGTLLIVLEEAPELQPQNTDHAIRIVQREGVFDLSDAMKATLRMYPDRIFIAELRDTLAYTFLRAIQSGHSGSSTTVHANSCRDAIDVVINFAANHESHPPRDMVRDILFRQVHTLIHAEAVKKPDGIARMIDEVVQLLPNQTLHTVAQYHQVGINEDGTVAGYFEFNGPTDAFIQEMFDAGIEIPKSWGWTV